MGIIVRFIVLYLGLPGHIPGYYLKLILWKLVFFRIMHNNLFHTPQEAHYVTVKKTNRLSVTIEDNRSKYAQHKNKYTNRQTQAAQGKEIILQNSR
jgi:hypothetical protein